MPDSSGRPRAELALELARLGKRKDGYLDRTCAAMLDTSGSAGGAYSGAAGPAGPDDPDAPARSPGTTLQGMPPAPRGRIFCHPLAGGGDVKASPGLLRW